MCAVLPFPPKSQSTEPRSIAPIVLSEAVLVLVLEIWAIALAGYVHEYEYEYEKHRSEVS